VAQALPAHIKPERMIRVALTAMTRVPKLADCDQSSFFSAMLTLSQLGLEPDGRRAHLIPYGKTCQLVIDYKGLVELAMRSGDVSNIHADVICRNDEFESNMGRVARHVIDYASDRGDVIAAYAICRFKDGSEKAEILSKSEIDGIRKRSRAGNSGPWVTDYNEMAKKTAFRRLSKWLPLSPEYRDALDKDADSLPPIRPAIDVQAPVFVMPPSEIPERTATEGGEA
jgi:recombination protein RecT